MSAPSSQDEGGSTVPHTNPAHNLDAAAAPVFPAQAKQIAQAASAASAPAEPPSIDEVLHADGSLDMRILMIALWKNRKNAKFTTELCARLPYLTISKPTLDQVEFYLPQLAHMVVHLEKELPMEAMEQFVLLLSQSSVHFALQFFWIIFAALDENRPKRGGNPRTFARCAQLLLALEQCFVYGSPAAKEASELLTRNSISKAEMDQIVMADRRFFAAQSSLEICCEASMALSSESSSYNVSGTQTTGGDGAGWLFKKGGGTSKMGRRNWKLRWCRIENRILLVFTRPSDTHPRTAFPLVRAEIRVLENKKHPFYFELVHELSETKMQFAAQSQEELVTWISTLQKHASAPEPPIAGGGGGGSTSTTSSPGKVSTGHTLARMSLAMRSFILQSSSGQTTVQGAPGSGPTVPDTTKEERAPMATLPPSPAKADSFNPSRSPMSLEQVAERVQRAQTVSSITGNAANSARNSGISTTTETGEASACLSECFQLQAQTSSLPPEQQRRYEFFSGMINFVKAITDVSESLRRIEPAKRKALLRPRLENLKIPPLAYIPLCKSTDVRRHLLVFVSDSPCSVSPRWTNALSCFVVIRSMDQTYCNVTSVFTNEGRVFSTNERAPCMIFFETEENESGDDVSKALFTHLYAGSDDFDAGVDRDDDECYDEDEDVTELESAAEILSYLEDTKSPTSPRVQLFKFADQSSMTASEREVPTTTRSSIKPPSPFLHQLLASPERKQKIEKIFGELTFSAIERLKRESSSFSSNRWRLCGLMAKSFDDLRQEVLVMQLISYFDQIFQSEGLNLWLHPYRILSTGASTGLLEVVRNTISLDGIKKTPGFKNLRTHFEDVYGPPAVASGESDDGDPSSSSDGNELLKQAELNFVHSLAAYSIVCYILAIKDRHNGNILLDIQGHIVHIDFGFFLGRAPGGSFSFETAPFKLTTEMVDVLGGRNSQNFKYFSDLCVQGALAARKHAETIYTLVEVMSLHSKLPCFVAGSPASALAGLRERLFLNVSEEKVAPLIRSMIDRSYDHFGTNKYDQFQVYSNGIAK